MRDSLWYASGLQILNGSFWTGWVLISTEDVIAGSRIQNSNRNAHIGSSIIYRRAHSSEVSLCFYRKDSNDSSNNVPFSSLNPYSLLRPTFSSCFLPQLLSSTLCLSQHQRQRKPYVPNIGIIRRLYSILLKLSTSEYVRQLRNRADDQENGMWNWFRCAVIMGFGWVVTGVRMERLCAEPGQ